MSMPQPRIAILRSLTAILTVGISLSLLFPAHAQESWMALIAPDNSLNFTFYKDMHATATLGMLGWGPNWGWRSLSATGRAKGDSLDVAAPFESNKDAGQIINVALHASKTGPRTVSFRYTLSADKDVPLTELVALISTDPAFHTGQVVVTQADGQKVDLPLSLGLVRGLPETSHVAFQSKDAGDTLLDIDPPTPLHIDNALRVVLAKDLFPKGTKTVTLKVTFPASVAFLAKDEDLARFTKVLPGPDWFPFTPTNDTGPSAIGFEDWLDKPAGKHGGVRMVGDHFAFEDGNPIKFWGTNLAYGGSAPEKADAEPMAARFAKWGVNAIRMHKFTGSGWEGIGDPNDVTKMDPAGLDRLDYFASQLTKHGVYYGWSHTFGLRPKPANRDQLLAYDEIQKNLGGNTYALINFAEDVQDLMIKMVVNLLKHRSPYTGKTYAEDPALCYIELQNEDDIFFYTTENAVNSCPAYKKRLMERWAAWLKQKYGSTAALKTAWVGALGADETIEANNISIQANPWFFGEDNLPKKQGGDRQRLLDNAAFFHDVQNQFYSRFARAIRDAGYKGPLVGSPWQAPAMLPHYYNLRSDSLVGYVDRHNYFGGGLSDTMLTKPGSGYLSSGLQQVAGRPFGLSEWIHVYPSLYSAEGPAILAAYGMGLQGWDASYEFQSSPGPAPFSTTVGNLPWGVWNVDTPTQVGQYPLLARMIARGDVKEGDVISVRRISPQDLATGKFSFTDHVTQQGDIKSFTGTVPDEALAAGRCLVEFTEKEQLSTFSPMSRFQKGSVIEANNNALAWDTSGKGYFTVNTRGTKAVVGFAEGKECSLGSVRIKMACPYASLFITAADKNSDFTTAKRAILSAVARNANTGFSYFVPDGRVLDNGKDPILLEPVKATVAFTGRHVASVNILDHDGKRTGRTLPVTNGQFTIDGSRDKTPYYEVVFG